MKDTRTAFRWLASFAGVTGSLAAFVVACGSSSSPSPAQGPPDASGAEDSASSPDTSSLSNPDTGSGSVDAGPDAPAATTTIAQARQTFLDAGSVPAITVNAIVTAIQGPIGDQVNWYIEDPAGGPYSGILVYCDPLAATTCPCMKSCADHVAAPPLNTLASISGKVSAYHGQLQLEPTAQTILQANVTAPPTYTASLSDLDESGNSPYRGVYVRFPSTVTVDNLTPPSLYDTECRTTDGGTELCTTCEPPTYSGFEVSGDSDAGVFLVEETFFPFVPLQSSPECLTQTGAVIVTDGEAFPFMAGILDVNPYGGNQVLSPVQPSDYGQ